MASDRDRRRVFERRERVLRLRLAGMSWPQIADEVRREWPSFSTRHAQVDAKRALEAARDWLAELAGLHLVAELEKLDSYQRTAEGIMRQALSAHDRLGALRAMDRLIAVGQRRDALLGLSATTAEAQARAKAESGDAQADVIDDLARRRAERRGRGR